MTILDEIAEYTRQRYALAERDVPLSTVRATAEKQPTNTDFPFEKALSKKGISYICEVKKASPSKGVIAEDFPYLTIAKEYEKAGASAISCLTEPKWFKGKNEYLKEIAENVNIPVLRKDFTVCPYQIYEAKNLGASAILLICSLLDTDTLKEYIGIAHSLGISALVEAHTPEEIQSAITAGARIIGVNNRNLKDFTVDVTNCTRLRKIVPPEILFVGESGIKTSSDIDVLRKGRVDAVLIGETLMRSKNKREMLIALNGGKL